MNQDNNELLKLLKGIKIWISVGSIGFLLIGVSTIIITISMLQLTTSIENDSNDIWDKASELYEQGKEKELLQLTDNRIKTHPNDASIYWYRAKVYYLRKNWDLALKNIEMAEFYSPSWKKEYTVPLRNKIQELSK